MGRFTLFIRLANSMTTLEIPFPALLKFRGRTDIRSMTVLEHGYKLQFADAHYGVGTAENSHANLRTHELDSGRCPKPACISFPPEPVPEPPKPIKAAVIESQTVNQPILVTCPSCKAEHEQGGDCSICTKLNRIRIKARDNRRNYAIQKQNERDVRMPCKD